MKILKVSQTMNGDQYPMGSHIPEGKRFVTQSVEALKTEGLFGDSTPFTHAAIICRGSSGAILGTLLSIYLPIPSTVIHIKKDGESSHNDSSTTRWEYSQKVSEHGLDSVMHIVIDDHIASGNTLAAIINKMREMDMPRIDAIIIGLGSNIMDMADKLILPIDYLVTDNWEEYMYGMDYYPSVNIRIGVGPYNPMDIPSLTKENLTVFVGGPKEWIGLWEPLKDQSILNSIDKTDGIGQSYGRVEREQRY